MLEAHNIDRFLGLGERLPELTARELGQLTIVAKPGLLTTTDLPKGLS